MRSYKQPLTPLLVGFLRPRLLVVACALAYGIKPPPFLPVWLPR